MRRFRIFEPFWLSFYSRDVYRDVARHWSGFNFLYLLLLLALAWVPDMIKLHKGMAEVSSKFSTQLIAQFPKIHIKNGEVSTDPPGPHYIKDPETGKVFIIIDTSLEGEALQEVYRTHDEVLILTRNQFITYNARRGQTRAQDLGSIQDFSVDQATIQRFVDFLGRWMAFLLYPFLVLFSFVYRLLQALLYGALGLLIASPPKIRLDYAACVRLATIAVTPVIILSTALDVAGRIPPGYLWWPVCFLLAMGYLYFGVKSNAESPAAGGVSTVPPQATPGQ